MEIYNSSFPFATVMVTKNKAKKSLSHSTEQVNKQQYALLLTSAQIHAQCYLDFVRPVHPAAYQSCIYILLQCEHKRGIIVLSVITIFPMIAPAYLLN